MLYPQEFIDKVKDTVDIVKLIGEYTDLKKAGPNLYVGLCPHPDHDDHDPSLRVWTNYKSWSCMVCHAGKKDSKDRIHNKNKNNNKKDINHGSDCIAFIQWMKGYGWRKSVEFLANKYHIPIPSDENELEYKSNRALAQCSMLNLQGRPLEYLKDRGLDLEDCQAWGIGWDGLKITFPLFDRYYNVLGFTRRWLDVPEGAKDKYNNSCTSKIFNKSKYFYGIQNIDSEEFFEEIRITEGPMDAILAHKHGARNVVATLGTAFTENHIELIKYYKKIPVFCMDGDDAGEKAIKRAVDNLADHGIYSKLLILPKGKDLCDMALELKDGLEEYIQEHSITYGSFLLQDVVSKFTAKQNELKIRYCKDIRDVIEFVPEGDEKIVLKSYIRNSMGIDI